MLELKEWLYDRVQDDNDIVVDDLQVTSSPWHKILSVTCDVSRRTTMRSWTWRTREPGSRGRKSGAPMWRRSQLTRRRLWRLLEPRLTDGTGTDSEGVTMTETLSKTNGTIRDLIRCRHAGNKEPDGKIVGQGQLIYENKDTFQVGTISPLSIISCLIRASSKMGSSTVWAC